MKIVLPVAVLVLVLLVAGVAAGIYVYNTVRQQSSESTNPTSTSMVCTPSTTTIGQSISCAATVTDTSNTKIAVTGTVTFTPIATCRLAGFASSETCYVSITTTTIGKLTVSASYDGDTEHSKSYGSTSVTVNNLLGSGNIPSSCQDPGSNNSHVYNPGRLQVMRSCITVSGLVSSAPRQEADGDYHIWLHLDAVNASLGNSPSIHSGDLVVEIICALPISQQDAIPACQNYANLITSPQSGQHITVSGPYVFDTLHNWYEIHPVYSLTISPSVQQTIHVTSEIINISYPDGSSTGWLGPTPRTIQYVTTVDSGTQYTRTLSFYSTSYYTENITSITISTPGFSIVSATPGAPITFASRATVDITLIVQTPPTSFDGPIDIRISTA